MGYGKNLQDAIKNSGMSVRHVASLAGISPDTLYSIIRRDSSVRFDHARNLILYSDRTMHEICAESGFTNYENFVRRFKQRFGQSPRSYKKLASSKPKSDK